MAKAILIRKMMAGLSHTMSDLKLYKNWSCRNNVALSPKDGVGDTTQK